MSKRLTNKWTATTTEAFGDNEQTRKGNLAELMYYKYAIPLYDEVQHFPSDRQKQLQGADIVLYQNHWSRPYTVDIKANMMNRGMFFVDTSPDGWLFNPRKTNDRVCHVCVETAWAIEYDANEMRKFIRKQKAKGPLIAFDAFKTKFPFKVRKFKMENANEQA